VTPRFFIRFLVLAVIETVFGWIMEFAAMMNLGPILRPNNAQQNPSKGCGKT
jgi:hypothetical protein